MRPFIAGVYLLAVGLAACAYDPVPKDYTGPMAFIADSYESQGSTLAYFFYVANVDGHSVDNALGNTNKTNYGKGFTMKIATAIRGVPAGDVHLTIEAAPHHAAPVLALGGSNYDISGDVILHARRDVNYVVKGELKPDHCAVWIEDITTKTIVTNKIEKSGC